MTTFIIHFYDGGIKYVDAYKLLSFKNMRAVFDIGHGRTITENNVVMVED